MRTSRNWWMVAPALALFAQAGLGEAMAAPITHFAYSTSFVQAQSTGFSTDPAYMQKQLSENGTQVATNRSFNGAEGTSSANAIANLQSGELKAFAEATASGAGGFFSAFGRSDFGDSFRTYDNDSPFTWTSGTEASFSFDISGIVDLNDAGNGSQFGLTILAPGALDPYARWLNGEDTFIDWNSEVITSFSYGLGPGGDVFPWMTDVVTSYPDTVTASFTPGSDFDWVLTLISTVDINGDFAAADAYGRTDFSNTLLASYDGPEGTTTYSASEVFPGTLPLSATVTTVPEPVSAVLLLAGLGMLAGASRLRNGPARFRRQSHPA